MGAAAENRPVIGSWELRPDEALMVEVTPPEGLYWSYSLGNPWWETIDYAGTRAVSTVTRRWSTTTVLRVVIAHEDPGVANWLDTAGHSAGPGHPALRAHRDRRRSRRPGSIPFADVAAALPAGTRRVTPEERRAVIAARRLAVSKRFADDAGRGRARGRGAASDRPRRLRRRARTGRVSSAWSASLNDEADLTETGEVMLRIRLEQPAVVPLAGGGHLPGPPRDRRRRGRRARLRHRPAAHRHDRARASWWRAIPQFRSLRLWESSSPCPPPESATEHTDPRIAETEAGSR